MNPLFSIHAGEYLTGGFIQHNFPNCRVWLPTRDTGIDLLVTNAKRTRTISLQVKFSKDFLPHSKDKFELHSLIVATWYKVKRKALVSSEADYWVFLLRSFAHGTTDYLVVSPQDLLSRFSAYHGKKATYDLYFSLNVKKQCWEVRGLNNAEKVAVASGRFHVRERNFTEFLNKWSAIEKLNR